ncbi:MAG TPA: DNA polymerase III subunit delta [Flavisolibacter sp.]|nr:DNA polymerase III subunit delta [Flavisolibacter sp.]
MSPEKIVSDIRNARFKPVYWLEGEENYFIDQVIDYAEDKILSEAEKGFNLTVYYGRDAQWPDVINSCRRYPMFSDKQVVIIKEAQDLKGIEKLEDYIEKPLFSTLLFVAYKGRKVDGRTKLAKLLKEQAVFLSTKKIYDTALPEWTSDLIKSKGFSITKKGLFLLIDHIGNDLSRLHNEIDKLALNLKGRANITEDDIEKFVGVSKEFNVFALQQAIARRDLYQAMRIVAYFSANPKAGPLQMVFPSLYNFFSKVQMVYGVPSNDEKTVASAIGVNAWFVKDYAAASAKFTYNEIEKLLLLLYEYNLRNLGVNDAGTDDAELMKEMVVKMITPL